MDDMGCTDSIERNVPIDTLQCGVLFLLSVGFVVIRKIFLSETGTKDLEITKKWKIVSDKKVGDGQVPSIPQSVTGQKISDKNPPYLSPVNFFSISSSVTVYLAEFNLE